MKVGQRAKTDGIVSFEETLKYLFTCEMWAVRADIRDGEQFKVTPRYPIDTLGDRIMSGDSIKYLEMFCKRNTAQNSVSDLESSDNKQEYGQGSLT